VRGTHWKAAIAAAQQQFHGNRALPAISAPKTQH
jgi:hypothetical protein